MNILTVNKIKRYIMKDVKGGSEDMEVLDLTSVYKKYKGEWVALKDNRTSVISHGKNLSKVRQEANKKGFSTPIYFKVPSKLIPYVS